MGSVGNVRIGHRAPHFHCEAVVRGVIQEVTLNTYIRPPIKPGEKDPSAPWLIILFIPAAFSFVCPTEVLAFQNCLDEFRDRNCNVVFVSVDTKHSLWHWQNVPRQYGGLGEIDIPLLSDVNHRIAQDYGVLIEEEGVSLRGMFIIDGDGIVQQITLNNLTVGRSVLEALRLLEAFQAVAKHGVLCPVDWKPSGNASDTINTISNMLTESYDERLANLQAEFGDVQVTDLDAKHSSGDFQSCTPVLETAEEKEDSSPSKNQDNDDGTGGRHRSRSHPGPSGIQEVICARPKQNSSSKTRNDCLPYLATDPSASPSQSNSNPTTATATPLPIPSGVENPKSAEQSATTARQARGMRRGSLPLDHRTISSLFSKHTPSKSLFSILHSDSSSSSCSTLASTDSALGHSSAPPTPSSVKPPKLSPINTSTALQKGPSPSTTDSNGGSSATPSTDNTNSTHAKTPIPSPNSHMTYESRRGSHVILEFADPTSNSHSCRPPAVHSKSVPTDFRHTYPSYSRQHMSVPTVTKSSRACAPTLARATSWTGPSPSALGYLVRSPSRLSRKGDSADGGSVFNSGASSSASTPGQTRLQATFEAIRKLGSGLASPAPQKGEGYFEGVQGVEV